MKSLFVQVKVICCLFVATLDIQSNLQVWKDRGKLALIAAVLWFMNAGQIVLADSFAYVGTNSGQFGTVDLNTGVFSNIGSIGITPVGIGVANGTLFTADFNVSNAKLYSINTANGSLSTIGSSGSSVHYYAFGSTTTGLYAVGNDSNLYLVNPATGANTLIGSTGLSIPATFEDSLSTNSSTLYFTYNANLYTLSTNTGLATLVGNMGGPFIGASVFENGVLWGGELSPNSSITTINTATGALTTVSTFTGTGQIWGLAPSPIPAAVPVPAAIWLFGSALASFFGFSRRKPM